jgi:urease accessory protein
MSDVVAMLLADGRTPTGSHAHSGSLEPAVTAGAILGSLPALIAARLRTVALVDAAFAAAATRADSAEALDRLEAEWLARTPSPAARATARALGRGLLRAAGGAGLHGDVLAAWSAGSHSTPRCVVLGAVGRIAGLAPVRVATISLYDDAALLAGAAPKLLPVDALHAIGWIAACAPLIESLARQAARDQMPAALPAASTPALDELAEAHARARGRLFAS